MNWGEACPKSPNKFHSPKTLTKTNVLMIIVNSWKNKLHYNATQQPSSRYAPILKSQGRNTFSTTTT